MRWPVFSSGTEEHQTYGLSQPSAPGPSEEGVRNEVKLNWKKKKKLYKSLRINRLTLCSFKHIPSIPAATLNLTPGAKGLSLDTPRHGNTHHITMTLQLVARLFVLEPQECSCCSSAVIPDRLGRCQVNVCVCQWVYVSDEAAYCWLWVLERVRRWWSMILMQEWRRWWDEMRQETMTP